MDKTQKENGRCGNIVAQAPGFKGQPQALATLLLMLTIITTATKANLPTQIYQVLSPQSSFQSPPP